MAREPIDDEIKRRQGCLSDAIGPQASPEIWDDREPGASVSALLEMVARLKREIGEHEQVEDGLRESEEKYRTLFDLMDEGFCTIELLFDENDRAVDCRFLEVNSSFRKQFGIKDALGRRARELIPQEHWFEIFGRIALTGEPARFEDRIGEPGCWYYVSAFRVGTPRERKVAVLFKDITEPKRTEEALRSSEERFRRYFDLGLIGMAITSPDKKYVEVNDELCRILGYERSELLQKTWSEITHPDDLAADVARFNRVMACEMDGYTMDKRWIRNDGGVIDSIVAAQCLRRADGSVDYFVGFVLDTTERRQAEAALRKTQAELAHVTRVTTMGELVASISHEINQPLGAIVNNCNVGLRLFNGASGSSAELHEIFSDVINDANRASAIIARIRSMTRRGLNEKAPVQLRDVVADVLSLAHRELTERRVTVHVELPIGLPEIPGDRVQLQQVLLNLVMNASEAMSSMPDGRRILTIAGQRNELDGRPAVLLTVHDLGAGFKTEDSEKLFNSFYTTKSHGLGMGLRISRSIVEAHGGRLWATPNDDAGATISCVLPAGPDPT